MIDDQEKSARGSGRRAVELRLLSEIVPGWEMRLIPEAVEKVGRGHAIETRRLKGSRFVVVILEREFDLDGLTTSIYLGEGFEESAAAIENAQEELQRHVAAVFAAHATDYLPWRSLPRAHVDCPPQWPGAITVGVEKIGDGSGYNSCYVKTAVFPVNPEDPLDWSLLSAISHDRALVSYFESVYSV